MKALLVGTVLAIAALAFVLYPLFFRVSARGPRGSTRRAAEDSPIVALREIEFDRATGKLSDADYGELKKKYSDQAIRELRRTAGAADSGAATTDPVEARAREYRLTHRECFACGVRPEADAVYCSTCGSYLGRICPDCSAEVTEPGAAFCSRCGRRLAQRQTVPA